MFDPRSRWARLTAFIFCLSLPLSMASFAAASPKGKGKGKKSVLGPKSSALSNALNDKSAQIQQCAMDNALDKGAKKAEVAVRVTINNKGEVVDTHINVKVDSGDGSAVQGCVEKVVRSAKFPTVPTPLATSERSWTVAQQ